ncbi:MAG: leucine-rich repeat protein [Lachnospiraceae bacterium]|nr:leucine-rich repeat protein [Lachnospiraceae bacterium]
MKKAKGMTSRIVAVLLSGMLTAGLMPGIAFASEPQGNSGWYPELAAEGTEESAAEFPSEGTEESATGFPSEGTEETAAEFLSEGAEESAAEFLSEGTEETAAEFPSDGTEWASGNTGAAAEIETVQESEEPEMTDALQEENGETVNVGTADDADAAAKNTAVNDQKNNPVMDEAAVYEKTNEEDTAADTEWIGAAPEQETVESGDVQENADYSETVETVSEENPTGRIEDEALIDDGRPAEEASSETAQDAFTEDAAAVDAFTEDTGAEETAAVDAFTEDTGAEETAAVDAFTEDTGAEDVATVDAFTEDAAAEDAFTEDTGAEETATVDAFTEDPVSENPLISEGETETTEEQPANAEMAGTIIDSGGCGIGDGVTWTLDEDGKLIIRGQGSMANYNDKDAPWYKYKDSLFTVIVESGVIDIGAYAFSGCSSLRSIEFPEGLESINAYAFSGCSSLSSVELPEGISSLFESTFSGCSSLTSIELPEGLEIIFRYAFSDCRHLERITLPSSLGMIETLALSGCSSLTEVIYAGTEQNWDEIYFSPNRDILNGITVTFLGKKNLKYASVTGLYDKTYTGEEITQSLVIEYDGITLTEGTDYTLYYENNIDYGLAGVTIIGKGDYIGKKEESFWIYKAAQTITASNLSLTYLKTGTITVSGNKGELSYKSSNTSIATVDSAGKVTAKGAGTAKITISAEETDNYEPATKTITVTVAKAAQSITVKAGASSVAVGKTTTVSITGAKGTKSFKSSDTTIATVTSAGTLTAKKVGTVQITATSASTSNYKAASKTVTIKVVPAAATTLTLENMTTGIKLTWSKATGATGYRVYREDTSGKTLIKKLSGGSTLTYTDTTANTNGKKYRFYIYATAGTGMSTLSKSRATYRLTKPAVSSVTNSAASKMTVKWGKNSTATGYSIQYSLSSSFASGNKTVTVAGASTVSKVIASLTKGKTYYVRIRTYKTVDNVKFWSAWSAPKSVKIIK